MHEKAYLCSIEREIPSTMKSRFLVFVIFATVALGVVAQRIAVLSDFHVSPGNANEKMLQVAIEEINSANYDLVVVCGDLTNEGSDFELTNVKSILDVIRHPLYVVPGNHESNWSQSAMNTFFDLWGNDRFVVEVDSLIVVGIASGPYMKMGNGHIKQEDLHWLRRTLSKRVTPGKRVLSFNHYPLLSPDLDNLRGYLQTLEEFPVVAHINGHYHKWRFYTAAENSGSDLPCAMLRSLDMHNGDYGYSVLEVDSCWVHIYDKRIGEPLEAKMAFPATTKHSKAKFREFPPLRVPKGFEVQNIWADSASVFTRLGFDSERVYFGNSLGKARAVDKVSGKLCWSVATDAYLFSRPVVMGKRVAIPMHDGILFLDAATGAVKNKRDSKEGPYVADGVLTPDGKGYIQGAYKRIERRRPSDGKLVWSYDSIFNYCQAAPAIDGNDLVFGAWDTNLRMLDLRTGKLRWVWNNGNQQNLYSPGNVVPVISGERVYIVAPDRYMTALDRTTGCELWRDKSHRYRESLGCSADGTRVYAKTMDGELVAVDASVPNFRELWTLDLGLGYEHAPCQIVEIDGYIYTGSVSGKVTITRADEPRHISTLPLGMSEVNGIDVDPYTGDVYVSLMEGTIFRIINNLKP